MYASPSEKRVTVALPRARPRNSQISSVSASLAVPQKILNLPSSWRARCGFCSLFGGVCCCFLSGLSVAVAIVAIASTLLSWFAATKDRAGPGLAVLAIRAFRIAVLQRNCGAQPPPAAFQSGRRRGRLAPRSYNNLQTLAGPLGFEPRQSAPKALDLPLVDGPVPSKSVDLVIAVIG